MRKEREAKMAESLALENGDSRKETFEAEQKKLVEKWSRTKQLQKEKESLDKEAKQRNYKVARLRRTLDEQAMEQSLHKREKTFDPSYSVSLDPISGSPPKISMTLRARRQHVSLPPIS